MFPFLLNYTESSGKSESSGIQFALQANENFIGQALPAGNISVLSWSI
jgi:hypothetical protein